MSKLVIPQYVAQWIEDLKDEWQVWDEKAKMGCAKALTGNLDCLKAFMIIESFRPMPKEVCEYALADDSNIDNILMAIKGDYTVE